MMLSGLLSSRNLLLIFLIVYQWNFCISADTTEQQNQVEKIYEPIPSTSINLQYIGNKASNFTTIQSLKIQSFMSIKHPLFNIIYVAALNGGLFVIDSSSQQQLQQFNIICKRIFLRKGQLYASMGKEGYSIYQINSQNGQLELVCNNQIGSSVDSIYVDSTASYIYIGSEGYIYLVLVTGQGKTQSDFTISMHVGIYSGESNYIYSTPDEQYLMVANLINGVSVINIQQKNQPYLVSQKLPEWQVVDLRMVNQGQIVYAVEEWYGLFVGDFSTLYQNENIFKAKDDIWVNHISFQGTSRAIEVSSDEKLLFVGLRSIGVYVFDISNNENKLNPILIQTISISGLANHIFLFNSDNSFLYANGCCLQIVNKVEANYNVDIPNVFNTHISRSYEIFDQDSIPWDYQYSSNSQYLYLAGAFQGIEVFQLRNSTFLPPIKMFSSNIYPSASTDSVHLIEEKNLLVQGSSEKGIILWDIKNLTSIKKVGEFNHPLQNSDSDGIVYNSKLDCLAIANGYQGAYLLDISDLTNLKMISEINVIDYDMQVTAESILMSSDANYLAISLRYYGLLIFNMKILKSPNLIGNFMTYGGEKCILSYDENYIFVSDGYKGITIINFIDKENAYIQSTLNLGAQALYAYQSMINQDIIYVSIIEDGQLAVIDISNKSSPQKMAQIQFGFEKSFALREAPNKQFITYLTATGLRFQSIGFQLKIHTQIRKITKQNNFTFMKAVAPNQPLLVGETIELIFSSILFNQSIKIQQVFYYKEFQVSAIESWMQFNQNKNKLKMVIDKNGLSNNNGLNILLLQILIKLNQTSFVTQSQSYSINAIQSNQIYQKLKQRAVLNENDYLNLDNFYQDSIFFIDLDNSTQYTNLNLTQDYIKQILLQSIYYQPIKFNVVSSLSLNIMYLENKQQPIQTISQSVKIIIMILDNKSYFIENKVSLQAQISMSQDFKSVVIEGFTINVNQVLIDGVQVVLNQIDEEILVQVILIDNINFDFIQIYKVPQLKFLQNAKQLKDANSLKQQFQDQMSESLTVQKEYTFTFSSNTFQYLLPQQEGIQFKAFLKQDNNNSISIQGLDWIDFDPSNRQFRWQGSLSQLSKKYTILINATLTNSNKYWATDEFDIHFERIPIEIIVMICIVSFFFLIIILLFYCYRAKIQYFRYFERYTYSSEPAIVNRNFYKIIILIPNYLGEFHKLWKQFIKNEKIDNNSTKVNFKKYLTQQKEIDTQLLIEKLKSIYSQNKHFYSKLKDQEFKITNFRLTNLVKGAFSCQMLSEDLATQEVYQQLKVIAQKKGYRKDWYKYYTKIVYPEKINEKIAVPTIEESNSHTNVDSYNFSQLEQNLPIIIIDENKIIFTLEEANSNSIEKNNSYNHYLLFEKIKSDGYGYTNKTIKRQEPSYGETIHIQHSNIRKVVAFKKREDDSRCGCFPKIRQKFFLDFQEIQNPKNSNLPEWIKCEVTQNSLILSGKPTSADVGDILIRIYDKNNYILNQFFINVRKMRKQTYISPEQEGNQYSQRLQVPSLLQQQLVAQNSKLSNQFLNLVPNKVLSSAGGSGILNTNTFYQQSPHTMNTNSPLPLLNQSSQQALQSQGQRKILRNHTKKNSQRYSIKQYKQLLNGELNVIRFKSENQIKDNSSVGENHKKNSDDLIYSKNNRQFPVYQDSPIEQNCEIKLYDKNSSNNYSSQMIHFQAQENNQDTVMIKDENLFKIKGQINQDNFDQDLYFVKPTKNFLSNYNSLENETIQEELQTNLKDNNKSHSSFNFNQNSRYKLSHQNHEEQSSVSNYKNYQESYEFEKSLALMSCEKIDINSPKLTQFKPISIKKLNRIPSAENIS